MSIIGEKRYITIVPRDGTPAVKFPAVIVGDPFEVTVKVNGMDRVVQKARMLSLRTTNPANGEVTSYLRISDERLETIFTPLRMSKAIGLDVDADGTVLDFATLCDQVADQTLAWLASNQATKAAPVEVDFLADLPLA